MATEPRLPLVRESFVFAVWPQFFAAIWIEEKARREEEEEEEEERERERELKDEDDEGG